MTQLTEQRTSEPANSSAHNAKHNAPPAKKSGMVAMVVLAILMVAGAFALVRRVTERGALAKETERLAIPTVGLIKPSSEPAADQLVLPAQLQAYVESAIYARTNGYLLRWNKDIGSQVKKGEQAMTPGHIKAAPGGAAGPASAPGSALGGPPGARRATRPWRRRSGWLIRCANWRCL